MKKRVIAFLMCAVMVFGGLPVSPLADYVNFAMTAEAADREIAGVSITQKPPYVLEGRTGELSACARDTGGNMFTDGVTFSWSSSDEESLTVAAQAMSSNCIATGVTKNTEATVTVSAIYDGKTVSSSCTIPVLPVIADLELAPYAFMMANSGSHKIGYTITPSNAGLTELEWTTSSEEVCTVSNGVVIPKGVGVCDVYAATQDGTNIIRSTCVIVSDGTSTVSLDKSDETLRIEESTLALKATCTLQNGATYEDAVKWSSSNPAVATVNSKGVVTPVGVGTAVITATTLDGSGSTAECKITAEQPVKDISVTEEAVCFLGETCQLEATVTPSNATEKSIVWSSGNDDIATVDQNGVVTGKNEGTVEIKVTTVDGGHEAVCKVSVEVAPTRVSVKRSTAELHVYSDGTPTSIDLNATVEPSNATNTDVTWSSSNEKVATVDENGNVTAVGGGTATITCKTVRKGLTAKCEVIVTQDAQNVRIINISEDFYFYVGKSFTLEAAILPSTATYRELTWSSSDTSVVTVSDRGVIKGISEGTASVTVTVSDKSVTPTDNESYTVEITVNPKINVSKITLNKTSATMKRTGGEKLYLFENVSPNNASDKSVTWSSSNPTIATVDAYGVVTPKSAGQTRIRAAAKDGSGCFAECMVTVVEPVTAISISKSTAALEVNQTVSLTATVIPYNASDKSVQWSSSNNSVATVSSAGLVTAKGGGTAIITAKTADGGYGASCTVTVTSRVKGIKINSGALAIPIGETRTVSATLSPADASNKTIYWKSTDESVVTVSSSGTITAKKTGTAEISATSQDGGYRAVIEVKVIRPATSVTLTFSSITLDAGKKKTLEASVKPLTATYKTVTWKSSNTNVAKVSSGGVITAVAAGTATITCTSTDGYASTTCKVRVTQPTTGIKVASSKATVKIGTPKTLTATVTPATASNKNVVWTTSDSKIATVSSNGVVSGVKTGKVTITARTADGLHSAKITVTVQKPVKSVSLNKTSITINVGKTSVLEAIIKPSSASDKRVTWSSSDNDVLKVSSSGKVTAKSAGYAVVTCTTKDGKKTAECSVLVVQPVKSVKLNKTKSTLDMNKTLKLKATVSPSSASNKAVKWTSSNSKVAKVTSGGTVKPIKPGTATITVTTKDGGYKATCKVTVVRKVKSVSLPEEKTVFLGEKDTMRAIIEPSNATNQKLDWTSSKKSVATVSSDGVITPKKLGKTIITVVTDDGDFKDTCKVTVKRALKSVKINKTNLSLNAGSSYSLKITKKPSNATESIIWTTSKRSVAVVNQDGVITAMGRGTATITGITEHGKKLKCKVTVKQPVTGMSISKKTADLYLGDTLTLTANVLPSNANDKSFEWSSSNKSVATVSGGKVTPKKPGTVTVTATSENGKRASCTVTVKQHVTSVALNKTSISLNKGTTFGLVAAVSPANASDKTCTFTSSNTAVATVTAAGVITAKAVGTAVITAKTNDRGKTATCKVTVTEKVTGVKLNKTSATIYTGDRLTLAATVSPSSATNKTVIWSSNNAAVATVNGGIVTAVKPGTADITVTTADGSYKATCRITVRQHVTGVTAPEAVTVNRGATAAITANVLPSNAYDKTVSWTSSDEDIAVVNDGVITGVAPGRVTITVTTADRSYKDTCIVTVNEPVTEVKLDITEVETLYKGETVTLTATVYPETETEFINRNVIWSTSDSSIATVEGGVVTAVGNGEATITVTTVDGSFTDTCKVNCFVQAE